MDYASYSNLQACISLKTDSSNFDLWPFRNGYDFQEEVDRIDKYLPKSRESNIYASFMNLKALFSQHFANYVRAFKYYDEALRIWPNSSIQKNKENCINDYERYLFEFNNLKDWEIDKLDNYLNSLDDKKSNEYASLLNIRGLIFVKRGQYAESIEYFNKALKIWPDNEQFLINKKECLYDWANYLFHDLEEYRQATEKINEYLAICENRYDDDYYDAFRFRNKILYDWAVKLFISNEYDESFKMVNDILLINEDEKNIDYAVTSNLKACIFDRWGQYDEAIKCYDEALKIDPDNPGIINNRQKTMEKLNNLR